MSIGTPEIATKYGALDSDAFASQSPFGAHVLRPMMMSANRLTSKGQHLATMLWPVTDVNDSEITGATFGSASAIAWPWWSRYVLPIPVPKRPGLNRGDLRVRCKITNGYRAFIAVETLPISQLQGTLPLTHPNVLAITGDGSFGDHELDEIVLSDADYDQIGIWIQGVPQAVDGTATYGSPYTGTITPPSDIIQESRMVDQAATWNTSLAFPSSRDYANDGHVVVFDGCAPRAVLNVDSPVSMTFGPPLEPAEQNRATYGGSYTLKKCPQITLATVSIAARART